MRRPAVHFIAGIFTLILNFMQEGNASAAERTITIRAAEIESRTNTDNIFSEKGSGNHGFQEISLTNSNQGWNFQGTVYNENRSDRDAFQKGLLNELYLDKTLGEWELTAGKKRIGWGTGFGFRPLDVLVHEPRRALMAPQIEGLPMLALEQFDGEQAMTFLCGNRLGHHSDSLQTSQELYATECAARYFDLISDWDTQFILHGGGPTGIESGAGISRAFGSNLEIHGEALYQRHYYKWFNTLLNENTVLANTDPVTNRRYTDGIQTVLGMTYTWFNGNSLLMEYWHDDSGYTQKEWSALRALSATQRSMLGTDPALDQAIELNLLASTRYLAQRNLHRENLLLHWSFDGVHIDPSLDILYMPEDKGMITTLAMEVACADTVKFNFGLRQFGGGHASMAGAIPDRAQLYVLITIALDG